MVRSSLLSLGVSLLLAATPIAAQTPATTSSTSTSSATTATGSVPTALPTDCVSGLQMFVARGSNEQPGLGRLGSLVANITQKIKDSRATAVDYPATFSEYNLSVGNGTSRLRSMVEDYAKKCPNNKMALLGYSQVWSSLPAVRCNNTPTL